MSTDVDIGHLLSLMSTGVDEKVKGITGRNRTLMPAVAGHRHAYIL